MKKITLLMLCSFSFAFLSQKSTAQEIFSNGPISTGATSTNATAAPAGYTWSELQLPNTTLGSGGIYDTAGTTDFSLADDFVVPAGQSWTVTSFDFFGYQTGYAGTAIPIDGLRVRVWNGDPSLPSSVVVAGDMVTNVLNVASSSNAFVYRTATTTGTTRKIWKFNANLNYVFAPGTYWVEFQVHATNDSSVFFPPVTILNTTSNASWNALQRNVTAWAPVVDGGSLNLLAIPFVLNGTVLAAEKFDFSSGVSIFPNPASNSLTINDNLNSETSSVEIYDVTGRIVMSSELKTNTIDVSKLNSGNYILKLKSENGTAVKKFIKL